MLNVLVANQDKKEGDYWRKCLEETTYMVTEECSDLSALVFMLTQEDIHIVICSMNLVGKDALIVIQSITYFFPRIKVILIGSPKYSDISSLVGKRDNITVRKEFDSLLEEYFKKLPQTPDTTDPADDLSLLLGEHFLSSGDAALTLRRAMPKWIPGFVVIRITADKAFKRVHHVISRAVSEQKWGYAVKMQDGTCVILENSPSEDACFGLADMLRLELLAKTTAMFSIGISRERTSASELYICCKEASRAAAAWCTYGKNSVIHINYLGDNDIEYVYPAHKEKRLIELTVDGDGKGAVHLLEEIFDVFISRENLSLELIKKFSLGIIVSLNIAAASKAKLFEQVQLETKPFKKLTAAESVDETFAVLSEMVWEFAKEMDTLADIQRDALYMQLSDLTLDKERLIASDLAHSLHTTICFINRSIAQNTGGNIFDFIRMYKEI